MTPLDRPVDQTSSSRTAGSSGSATGASGGEAAPSFGASAVSEPAPTAVSEPAATAVSEPAATQRRGLGISLPQVVGGALAAASAAVASSQLGVAGTAIGAVLASVVISVGTALYTRPIERTSQVLRETLPVRVERSRLGPDRTHDEGPARSGATLPKQRGSRRSVRRAGEPDSVGSSRRIVWTAVAVSALATAALAFALLTGLEQVTGKPVSSWTGHGSDSGTTLGRIFNPGSGNSTNGSSGSDSPQQQQQQQPAGSATSPNQPTPPTVTVTVPTTPAPSTTAPSTTAPTSASPTTPTATTPTQPTPTAPTSTSVAPKALPSAPTGTG